MKSKNKIKNYLAKHEHTSISDSKTRKVKNIDHEMHERHREKHEHTEINTVQNQCLLGKVPVKKCGK